MEINHLANYDPTNNKIFVDEPLSILNGHNDFASAFNIEIGKNVGKLILVGVQMNISITTGIHFSLNYYFNDIWVGTSPVFNFNGAGIGTPFGVPITHNDSIFSNRAILSLYIDPIGADGFFSVYTNEY